MTISPPNQSKRKATTDEGGDFEMSTSAVEATSKRSKIADTTVAVAAPASTDDTDPQVAHARAAAAFIPFLTPENLLPPKLPTREEMESVLLNLRKQALVEEYFGTGDEQA